MTVTAVFPYSIHPGRMNDAIALLREVKQVGEELGGRDVRLMHSVAGGRGGSEVGLTMSFADMAAYGKSMDGWRDSPAGQKILERLQSKDAPVDYLAGEVYEELPL